MLGMIANSNSVGLVTGNLKELHFNKKPCIFVGFPYNWRAECKLPTEQEYKTLIKRIKEG